MKKKLFAGAGLLGALALGLSIGVTSTAAEPADAYYADKETDTFRLWVNRNNHYVDGYNWYILDKDGTTFTPSYLKVYADTEDENNLWLAYYDLPTSVIGEELTIVPYGTDEQYVNDASIEFTYESGDNAQVYYIGISDSTWILTQGTANQSWIEYGIPAATYATVMEAYYTCSSSKDNGYGNFGQVFETWFCYDYGGTEEMWHVGGELSSVTIADYAAESDYVGGDKVDTGLDLWTKVSYMLELYNENVADDASSESIVTAVTGNSGVALAALGALAAVAVVGVGTYLIISRRKKA